MGRPSDGRTSGERIANIVPWPLFYLFFYQICFDADVTGNSNFCGKGVSKTTCKNAVARILLVLVTPFKIKIKTVQ